MKKNFTLMAPLLSFILTLALTLTPLTSYSYEKNNRLGIGMSNELQNNFPALSFKVQKSTTSAIGGLIGISTDKTRGGYGVGLKIYHNIYDEPQLNFYLAGMGALLSNNTSGNTTTSGFQLNLALGSEFHFTGLSSIAFSFEFGVSAHKKEEFVFQTLGNNFIVSAIHFYL